MRDSNQPCIVERARLAETGFADVITPARACRRVQSRRHAQFAETCTSAATVPTMAKDFTTHCIVRVLGCSELFLFPLRSSADIVLQHALKLKQEAEKHPSLKRPSAATP